MAFDTAYKYVEGVQYFERTNTYYRIRFQTGERARLYIMNNHVFRLCMSPNGEFSEYPLPVDIEDVGKIVAKSMDEYGYEAFNQSILNDSGTHYIVQTPDIQISFDKGTGIVKVVDLRTNKEVFCEKEPLSYTENYYTQTLSQRNDEYFYGGGMQNGRFSHKSEIIHIRNTNYWDDGGITSPCPFYWSSYGYGVLRNSFQPGLYDFGVETNYLIELTHGGQDFDAFFFINSQPKDLLNDYYELTGQPLLMPEFSYYEAHLSSFNRDYWVEVASSTPGARLFEDGLYYKSYRPREMENKTGILESFNGENNNYQFSARAMIDRYKKHDIPLGWFVPNDGYGCGYGQTDTMNGDVENLKEFVKYSKSNGVEVGLWTEGRIQPADPLNPKKGERDLCREIDEADIVALKCDVAWVGTGYSLGLTCVEIANNIFVKEAKVNVRPMVLMVDGWAGTQRYAGIWSGDQSGGEWEYIRFHIPTYIGASLSGQPIIGSDMDGIHGGGSKEINIRDYQFKTFTPLQLNMDGWSHTPKTPFNYDEEATKINRAYLKLKSMLMPYNYSIGYESTHGLPMVRAMFLEFPEEASGYTKDSQYQYMWGPNILVAPIYNDVKEMGKSVRDGIYLPCKNQVWIDFLTGEKYQGGKIYNNILSPLWKIPVFIKEGSIIPMTNPNNNPYEIKRDQRIFTLYPQGTSDFIVYEDDGRSSDYLNGGYATTKISLEGPPSNEIGPLLITIYKTNKSYKNMTTSRSTYLQIMASQEIENITAQINENSLTLSKVDSFAQFESQENVYYFKKDFDLNPYLSEYGETKQHFLLIKIEKMDVTANEIVIKINGFTNNGKIYGNYSLNTMLGKPKMYEMSEEDKTLTSITIKWDHSEEADFYEIERDGITFTNITGNSFTFKNLLNTRSHEFRMRTVLNNTVSEWTAVIAGRVKVHPLKYLIRGVTVKSNLPTESKHKVHKLTDGNLNLLWHGYWGASGKMKFDEEKHLVLHFDLGDIYDLDRADYLRRDCNEKTVLVLRYRYSSNGIDWTDYSEDIKFPAENSLKTIHFHGVKMRFVELLILESVDDFGIGMHMSFIRKPDPTEEI